ncbi:MAG: phage tail tape measure protein, partial [Candidatus Omnitrophica bacterium]|nr:phage tail tape measure protein [Candidatus Omnitrophota bacterium]
MPSTDLSIIIKAKDEASAKFKNLGRIIKDTQPSFMALAAGSAAVAGGVTLIGAKAVKMASQFQTGIAEVSTLVNTAEVDMSKLGSAVLDMSKAVPQSAAILTKGLYQVISASVPVSKSMDVLAVASKAATAGLSDTFTAVDSITTIMNAYGMTAEDTTRISDIMFTTVRKGKCITGDTLILQPDGTYLRIDNLLENKDKPLLDIPSIKKVNAITFDEGKFVVTKANWWYRGKKQVKVLTTFSGKQIRTTPEHPYLTAEGWKPVSDLSVGDSIVTPAELPFFGTKNIGIERAELVGMLLGDGAMGCGATTPSISVAEDILIKRIIKLGNRIGLFPVELKYKNAISRVSLRANKTRGGGNKNPFTEWLREIGLMGLNCYEKHIVDDIWTWDKESLRYLLKGLFETDGGLCLSKSTKNKRNAKNLSIAYCSCSEKLSKDIQRLLLKFGIFSTLRHRENLYTYKNNTKLTHSYHVEIKRGQDVRLFLAKITTFDKYPQKTIEFIERLKWIPYEVNRIGQAILEKIISIEDGEVEDVFDLTIDHKESNFVANDIVAHNTTFTELASQIGSVATPAAKAGVRIEEVSAALATMTKKGLDTANATTYLRQIIMSVLKPTSEAAEAADRLGLDFTSAALKSKGLAGFLKDVEEKTKGNSDELVKLFGNVRAFTGALTITGEGAQSFAEDLEAMDNAAGATEEAFGKMMATFTAQWTIFKNVMTTIWIKIGDQLLPVITKLVQSLKGLADGFSNLSNTQAKYIVVIGSIVGAAAGLIAAFSGIMLILPSVIAGVKALGITLTFLATNPISLAIIAIGAIAAITYGWYKA